MATELIGYRDMSLELWREITAEYNGRKIKGSFKFIDGRVDVRTQHGSKTEPPSRTDSITVDELLGMA